MPKLRIDVEEHGAKKAEKSIGGLSKSLGGLAKTAGIAAGVVGGAMAVAIKKGADLAAEQEKVEKKLTQALGGNIDALKAQASALQGSTTFGDEATIAQMSYLASIGMTEAQIKEMIPVAMDLAAATGMTLEGAVRNTSKTLSGMTGELGESVPALRNLTAEQLRAGEGVKLLGEQFKGMAATEAQTFSGAMAQMQNAIGDAGEELGFIFLPLLETGAKGIKKFAEKTASGFKIMQKIDWKATGKGIIKNSGLIGQALLDTFKVYLDYIPDAFGRAFNMVWPAVKGALELLWEGIKIFAETIWDPLFYGAQLIGAKIQNKFIEIFNGLKEGYNNIASFFGMESIDMTELVDLTGLQEKFEGTSLVSLVMGNVEDNIQTGEQLLDATSEIWAKTLEQLVEFKEDVKEVTEGASEETKAAVVEDTAVVFDDLTKIFSFTGSKIKGQTDKIKDYWKNATADQKLQLKIQADSFAANLQTMAKEFPAAEKAAKRAAQVQATVDAYASAVAAYKAMAGIPIVGPGLAVVAAGVALAAGMANVQAIEKAATGADFVTNGPQMLMVGDNPSGAEHVSVTPLGGDPNIKGPQGGGAINISFNSPIMSEEYTEDVIIPHIKTALRRGTTLD